MKLVNDKYIIEEVDILDNSEITLEDLQDLYNNNIASNLFVASNKVYNIMYSAYRGLLRTRQVIALNYMIKQSTDLQNGMRDAIIEYIRGAVYSGIDLKQYESNENHYSKDVMNILRQNGLWILSTIEYQDSEIE